MPVLVTRPAREAQRWVQRLRQHGLDAFALPLLDIGPAPDPAPVWTAWDRLAGFDAVMFVSGNAVDGFFSLRPAASDCWPVPSGSAGPRAWAPGPGTAQALLEAGVPAAAIDQPLSTAPQFDSEALWGRVGDQLCAGQRVLVVRGAGAAGPGAGRDWLAARLVERGIEVTSVAAYRRTPPAWTPAQFALGRHAADATSIWLFSSSEAIISLRSLLPEQDRSHARAIATHPRIAATATEAGFGVVCLSRPALDDVVRSIESMR